MSEDSTNEWYDEGHSTNEWYDKGRGSFNLNPHPNSTGIFEEDGVIVISDYRKRIRTHHYNPWYDSDCKSWHDHDLWYDSDRYSCYDHSFKRNISRKNSKKSTIPFTGFQKASL